MKMMMIYDLWLLMIGWGLFLNGARLLACILFLIGFILFIKSGIKINCWRYFVCMLISALFNIAISQFGTFNKDFMVYAFLVLESLLVSFMYKLSDKLKLEKLINIYFVLAISFLAFLFIAYLVPDTANYIEYKLNVYTYIVLIFVPPFFLASIQILKKLFVLGIKMKAWNH